MGGNFNAVIEITRAFFPTIPTVTRTVERITLRSRRRRW